MRVPEMFKGVELIRMVNGDYCLVRPLGLVPGGKGMRYHENILRLTPSGIASKLWALARMGISLDAAHLASGFADKEAPALGLKPSPQQLRATARD